MRNLVKKCRVKVSPSIFFTWRRKQPSVVGIVLNRKKTYAQREIEMPRKVSLVYFLPGEENSHP